MVYKSNLDDILVTCRLDGRMRIFYNEFWKVGSPVKPQKFVNFEVEDSTHRERENPSSPVDDLD